MKRFLRIAVEPLRRLGLTIGRINTFLILSLSYYVVLFPMGLVRRLLSRRKTAQSWKKREPLPASHFDRQF